MIHIEVEDLHKSYGEGEARVEVLRGVNLQVERGSMNAILGPSGSGKSTLLNAIGGLESVDKGSIRVEKHDITTLGPKELSAYRRATVGFVFQFYNLIPNLTISENILVCQYLSSDPLDTAELLSTLGLADHANKFPSELSGGQQQRCALARALVKNPSVLLCDEPTGALDTHTAREILMLLELVNKRFGTTMLIVTHSEGICAMVDQIVTIKDGLIERAEANAHKIPAGDIQL